jgi:hypothetical protein
MTCEIEDKEGKEDYISPATSHRNKALLAKPSSFVAKGFTCPIPEKIGFCKRTLPCMHIPCKPGFKEWKDIANVLARKSDTGERQIAMADFRPQDG